MSTATATVETLTAEVRVLMVGSRQVTLSVFGQLDRVGIHAIEPFGRVHPRDADADRIYVVGRSLTGTLVRSEHHACWPSEDEFQRPGFVKPELSMYPREPGHPVRETGRFIVNLPGSPHHGRILPVAWRELRDLADEWEQLPLIVLAGLR